MFKILRGLLPEKFQGSVRKKFFKLGQTASISKVHVQYTESQLAEAQFNSGGAAIAAGYCQLHLFVMRNCAAPVKAGRRALFQAIDQRLLPKMANLATELGFKSQKIRLLCERATAFHIIDSRTAMDQGLEFAADTASLPKSQRCGKPDHTPHCLFLDTVRNDNKSK
ncbi:hypothetical protein ACJ73_09049 [Blastomyces percursus]|uniref:Uncharacterized protein n=1 Tax=Blastomyces percursus TaxID=1658174 RepID=A0A1J9QF18_9EURO|nr:hypothetical protein ACJ73_09049 [Blastomyces percursus]